MQERSLSHRRQRHFYSQLFARRGSLAVFFGAKAGLVVSAALVSALAGLDMEICLKPVMS
jgi:hypothetical protein